MKIRVLCENFCVEINNSSNLSKIISHSSLEILEKTYDHYKEDILNYKFVEEIMFKR